MSSRCRNCGRRLTDPRSIERGYGPKCYKESISRESSGGTDPPAEREVQIPGQMTIFEFPDFIP